jgi:hypothetical protein
MTRDKPQINGERDCNGASVNEIPEFALGDKIKLGQPQPEQPKQTSLRFQEAASPYVLYKLEI